MLQKWKSGRNISLVEIETLQMWKECVRFTDSGAKIGIAESHQPTQYYPNPTQHNFPRSRIIYLTS